MWLGFCFSGKFYIRVFMYTVIFIVLVLGVSFWGGVFFLIILGFFVIYEFCFLFRFDVSRFRFFFEV